MSIEKNLQTEKEGALRRWEKIIMHLMHEKALN